MYLVKHLRNNPLSFRDTDISFIIYNIDTEDLIFKLTPALQKLKLRYHLLKYLFIGMNVESVLIGQEKGGFW